MSGADPKPQGFDTRAEAVAAIIAHEAPRNSETSWPTMARAPARDRESQAGRLGSCADTDDRVGEIPTL
jgi:hypothetical protein